MFIDDKPIQDKSVHHHVNHFSSTLKQNIVEQAASMLLQHVTLNRKTYHTSQNTNGNAFDEHYQRKKKDFRRTRKCYSWLSKFPTKSDTSLNRSPSNHCYPSMKSSHGAIQESPYILSRIQPNQMTLSSNAATNIINDFNLQTESFAQPFIMVHKKRLRRNDFLSTMQNCIQLPFSQNHFYALDQVNMLKLQRNLHVDKPKSLNLKRKYSDNEMHCHCSEMEINQTSPFEPSLPKTADHISINKYHDELKSPSTIENKQKFEQSHVILSRLEKILDLCGELRSMAKDVELHLNEHSISKTISIENNEKEIDLEPTTIDIYKELEQQQTSAQDNNVQNDTSSIHSESNKSIQLMQIESFKTKSPSLRLRKSEDICSCFLKSFLDKENCQLTYDEQEYLNELTRAYILGREQLLKEQQETNNKLQTSINESLSVEKSEEQLSSMYDTNNNNQFTESISPLSILPQTTISKIQLVENDKSSLAASPEMISLKHEIFLHEPIAMKTINVLPGIGKKYAEQLEECGFTTVRRLLGFYLMIKNDKHFVLWLNNKAGISIHSAWLCTNALRSWCQTHL